MVKSEKALVFLCQCCTCLAAKLDLEVYSKSMWRSMVFLNIFLNPKRVFQKRTLREVLTCKTCRMYPKILLLVPVQQVRIIFVKRFSKTGWKVDMA